MSKRMLIDGTHSEEIRVVITSGNRLEEYDVETSTKTQLRGNIYLAKVTRVEPSLQAAFVDYGGNRHGFLAFNEIHPDYYQIPIEDREKLMRDVAELDEQDAPAQAARAHVDSIDGDVLDAEEDEDDPADEEVDEPVAAEAPTGAASLGDLNDAETQPTAESETAEVLPPDDEGIAPEQAEATAAPKAPVAVDTGDVETADDENDDEEEADEDETREEGEGRPARGRRRNRSRRDNPMRRYRIQEVIKRRQILLVQVVKEERGNKGAALTTYLSLAGRYCVLMPNTVRGGGGISRKITSATDRRRLRDLVKDLNVPEGMGVIMRTAGMERSKAEIKRDFDYLIRVWEDVRELTLKSAAPTLVYEEGNLIKRAIRDLYTREIEEVLVEGGEAYQTAKKLMRLMMPSHAKRVQPYRDPTIPLFHRYQVESQLEAMHSPVVQLKSGGYLVINPTEALVSIDVNSGRSTRERNIEETALKTNLEAATEIARQLRMRDLAGLIVIDFIDMDDSRNQRAVERRFKEAVKPDRARIQLGRISTFGLFELSRQRMRPSLMETSTEMCPHCHGSGYVRSIESTAIRVLRSIEEEGIRNRSSEVVVSVATPIALYILNQKRDALIGIEERYSFKVAVHGDDTLIPPDMKLERTKARADYEEAPSAGREQALPIEEAEEEEVTAEAASVEKDEHEGGRKRRSRRRRRKDADATQETAGKAGAADESETVAEPAPAVPVGADAAGEEGTERPSKRRRRGRRGGKRRGGRATGGEEDAARSGVQAQEEAAEAVPLEPVPPDETQRSAGDDNGASEPLTDDQPVEPVIAEAPAAPEPEPPREPATVPVNAAARKPAEPVGATTEATEESYQPGAADDTDRSAPGKPGTVPPTREPPAAPKRGWWQRMLE